MKKNEGHYKLEAALPIERCLRKGCLPGPLSPDIFSNIIEKYVPHAFLIRI